MIERWTPEWRVAKSLALHDAVARHLLADPSLIQKKIIPTLERFKQVHRTSGSLPLLEQWEQALQAGVDATIAVCRDPREGGRQLRQASPMAGILSDAERKAIIETIHGHTA